MGEASSTTLSLSLSIKVGEDFDLKLPPKEMAETEELESFAQLNVASQRVDDQSIGIIQPRRSFCQHCPDQGV